MKQSEACSFKYMRLMVLFDLPTKSKKDRRVYAKFRKFLIDDGFIMMQYSVYSRFCKNDIDANKHITRIKNFSPDKGNVRIIKITENQFEKMIITVGKKSLTETTVNSNHTLVIE